MLVRIGEKNQDSRDVPLAAADAFAKTSAERCASGTTTPIARHPAPTKARVFARSRPCSYASHSRGTRARAESRPRGRLSRGRARTRTRPRLLFPANLLIASTAIRARPADSRLGRRVASVDVRRARDEPDSSRDRRRRATPRVVRVEVRGALGFRRLACVTGRRSRWLVGSSRAFPIGRSSGARPRTRHRDARATLEDDDRLVAPRASRVFRARALARLDERDQARRPTDFRSGSFVAVEISAGSVALGADFRLEKRGDAGYEQTGGAASACRRRPSHPSTRQPAACRLP